MKEVQKNETGVTVPETDGRPQKEEKPKRELTPQQAQQRKKMIVFPLMFLAFAGCMYLILRRPRMTEHNGKKWAVLMPIFPCRQRTE